MRPLLVKRVYCVADCQRIQQIALANQFELTLRQCQHMWQAYSDSWCAGWLVLPKSDDEIWNYLADFIEEDLSHEN